MSILVLTSDTLIGTPATGNLEYNGQFFGTDSNSSRAQLQRIVRATAVASTSGTSIDFTGIPAWVERITVMFSGVSGSGTSSLLVQLGTGSTTYTTSGYSAIGAFTDTAANIITSTAGFPIFQNSAGSAFSGTMTITNITGNTWVANHSGANATGGYANNGGGNVALGAVLTAVRITRVNGTDTFDAGTVNIIYEG